MQRVITGSHEKASQPAGATPTQNKFRELSFLTSCLLLLLIFMSLSIDAQARGRATISDSTVLSDIGTRLRGPYYKFVGKTYGNYLYPINSKDPFLYTSAYWQQYKDMGYNSVRIAVAWGTYSYPDFSQTNTLAGLDALVDAITSLDMYITICGSSSDFSGTSSTYHLANLQAEWAVLAPRYKDNPNVNYEIQNEPMGDPNGFHSDPASPWGNAAELVDVCQTVRAAAPNTIIGMWGFSTLSGLTNDANWAINANSSPGDIDYTKTAVVFHYYPKNATDETNYGNYISRLQDASFPVWMTETSDTEGTTDEDLLWYKVLEQKGVSWNGFEMQQGWVNGTMSGTMAKMQAVKTYLEGQGYGWSSDWGWDTAKLVLDYSLADGTNLHGQSIIPTGDSSDQGFSGTYIRTTADNSGNPTGFGSTTYSTMGLNNFGAADTTGAIVVSTTSGTGTSPWHVETLSSQLDAILTGTVYMSYEIFYTQASFGGWNFTYDRLYAGGLCTAISQAVFGVGNKVAVGYGNISTANSSIFNPQTNTPYCVIARFTHVGEALSTSNPGIANLWVFDQTAYADWETNGSNEADLDIYAIATASATATSGTYYLDGTWSNSVRSHNVGGKTTTQYLDNFRVGTGLGQVTPSQGNRVANLEADYSLSDGTNLHGQAIIPTGDNTDLGFSGTYTRTTDDNSGNPTGFGSTTYTTVGLDYFSTANTTGALVVSTTSGTGTSPWHVEILSGQLDAILSGTVYIGYEVLYTQAYFGGWNFTHNTLRAGDLCTAMNQAVFGVGNKVAVGYGSNSTANSSIFNPQINTPYFVIARFTHVGEALSTSNQGIADLWVFDQTAYADWETSGSNEADLHIYAIATASATATSGTYYLDGTWVNSLRSHNVGGKTTTQYLDNFRVGGLLVDVAANGY